MSLPISKTLREVRRDVLVVVVNRLERPVALNELADLWPQIGMTWPGVHLDIAARDAVRSGLIHSSPDGKLVPIRREAA